MSDDETLLTDAKRLLDELSTFNFMRVAQGESPAPAWLTTVEGQRFIAALERGAVDEAVAIYAAARQTGKSRREVESAGRQQGFTVYGSALPLPGESRRA